jgi:hypothetical protein
MCAMVDCAVTHSSAGAEFSLWGKDVGQLSFLYHEQCQNFVSQLPQKDVRPHLLSNTMG